jgi:hypothetical protein
MRQEMRLKVFWVGRFNGRGQRLSTLSCDCCTESVRVDEDAAA